MASTAASTATTTATITFGDLSPKNAVMALFTTLTDIEPTLLRKLLLNAKVDIGRVQFHTTEPAEWAAIASKTKTDMSSLYDCPIPSGCKITTRDPRVFEAVIAACKKAVVWTGKPVAIKVPKTARDRVAYYFGNDREGNPKTTRMYSSETSGMTLSVSVKENNELVIQCSTCILDAGGIAASRFNELVKSFQDAIHAPEAVKINIRNIVESILDQYNPISDLIHKHIALQPEMVPLHNKTVEPEKAPTNRFSALTIITEETDTPAKAEETETPAKADEKEHPASDLAEYPSLPIPGKAIEVDAPRVDITKPKKVAPHQKAPIATPKPAKADEMVVLRDEAFPDMTWEFNTSKLISVCSFLVEKGSPGGKCLYFFGKWQGKQNFYRVMKYDDGTTVRLQFQRQEDGEQRLVVTMTLATDYPGTHRAFKEMTVGLHMLIFSEEKKVDIASFITECVSNLVTASTPAKAEETETITTTPAKAEETETTPAKAEEERDWTKSPVGLNWSEYI